MKKILKSMFDSGSLHLVVLAVALLCALALSGCKNQPPIVLYEYAHIGGVREFEKRAVDTIRAYGCEVDDIKFGIRNGTFVPVTVVGRRKTSEEIYRERLRKAEAELAEVKSAEGASNE